MKHSPLATEFISRNLSNINDIDQELNYRLGGSVTGGNQFSLEAKLFDGDKLIGRIKWDHDREEYVFKSE